ncbi:phage integrase SAM-like domain-containing protein [Chryseobacterium indologenes]|uniref:phage integrase SAM-like domain-containing protein n=1 Tax=Chryseobacterium indologenes TaxID=253 RepID=UPI000B2519F2|nr:phage integrase SAM-like domain-containing protein [Chryseobacterium indologenes]
MEECFLEHCDKVIADMGAGLVKKKDSDLYSDTTIRTMKQNIKLIRSFVSIKAETLKMKDVDKNFVDAFHQFLLDKNLAKNTISGKLDGLRFWIKRFHVEKLMDYKGEVGKYPSEITTAISLSIEELQALYVMKLPEGQRKVLDIFICQSFLGLRVGDMFKFLQNINCRKRTLEEQVFFEVHTGKKCYPVVIPAATIVMTIIEKYGNSLQKGFSESHYNITLKKIVAKSTIDREVAFFRTEGGRKTEKIVQLSSLISSHTARRTFATNGYLSGISPFDLMKITGHRSLQSFFRYMRCENIAVAFKISSHKFFRIKFSEPDVLDEELI